MDWYKVFMWIASICMFTALFFERFLRLPGLGSGDVYPLSVASKLKSVKKDIP